MTLRARLIAFALAIALVAVLALGIPLAVVGERLLNEQAHNRLAREAAAVAGAIDEQADTGRLPTPDRLAALVAAGRHVRVEGPGGAVVEAGPSPGDEVRRATTVLGAVRVTVSEPGDLAEHRVHQLWLLIAAAGAGGLALAAGLSAWQAGRLARPLERLAEVSRRLGRGDLAARAGPQDVPEVDAVARALDHSAEEIARRAERERAFSANVAHQLRSPLTALDMRLEELAASADPDVRREALAALDQTERLRRTTDDLLALARRGDAGVLAPLDAAAVAADRVEAWSPAAEGAGRRLRCGAAGGRGVGPRVAGRRRAGPRRPAGQRAPPRRRRRGGEHGDARRLRPRRGRGRRPDGRRRRRSRVRAAPRRARHRIAARPRAPRGGRRPPGPRGNGSHPVRDRAPRGLSAAAPNPQAPPGTPRWPCVREARASGQEITREEVGHEGERGDVGAADRRQLGQPSGVRAPADGDRRGAPHPGHRRRQGRRRVARHARGPPDPPGPRARGPDGPGGRCRGGDDLADRGLGGRAGVGLRDPGRAS